MNRCFSTVLLRRCALCLLAIALLLTCLAACSGEIYDPTQGSLSINEGTGNGNGVLELPTEKPTGSSIVITPDDPFENAAHLLQADFLNTGNSDAILIRMDDTVILVDTGESDDYHKISTRLNELGITEIDYLIISHYDNDHIGTVSQVLQNYTVKQMYMPDYVRDSNLYRRMMATLEAKPAVQVHRLHDEDVKIELAYGSLWINATGLYEAGVVHGNDNAHDLEENNYSLITSVYFGDVSILLAGDAEQDRITEFMELVGSELAYDVIKIPHHGGYDKALKPLFEQNKGERYCMVHAGQEGLVEGSLKTAMRTSGAAAKFTYNGDILFVTDGVSMTVR